MCFDEVTSWQSYNYLPTWTWMHRNECGGSLTSCQAQDTRAVQSSRITIPLFVIEPDVRWKRGLCCPIMLHFFKSILMRRWDVASALRVCSLPSLAAFQEAHTLQSLRCHFNSERCRIMDKDSLAHGFGRRLSVWICRLFSGYFEGASGQFVTTSHVWCASQHSASRWALLSPHLRGHWSTQGRRHNGGMTFLL